MDDSITPEQSIMLCMAALYIAMTEAITEVFGRPVEPAVNRLIRKMMPHLPEDAADMCGYMLEFASGDEPLPPLPGEYSWLNELADLPATATAH